MRTAPGTDPVRGPYDLKGLGHGSELNERVGTSAAGISLLGGEFNPMTDEATIEVYNILGRLIMSRQLYHQRTQIDLPQAYDVFFIRVSTAEGSKTFKILRQPVG